jgi:uncharacterized damage-inducible protein DinB
MPVAQSSISMAQTLLKEFEIQAPITRKFLERLPEDRLTWKPHAKSLTAGQLAYHIAQTPGGIAQLVQMNPMRVSGPPTFPQPSSLSEILATHDEGVETVRRSLPAIDDEAMEEIWRLSFGEKEVAAVKRKFFLREIGFSHWYQHRGQFSVYLRLLDIPVPATWGPSADEMPSFLEGAQQA